MSKTTTKVFEEIITREVERLDVESRLGGLEMESARKLEVLARSWRAYSTSKIESSNDDLGDLSTDELIAIARGTTKVEVESSEDPKGEGSSQESGSVPAVEN
jgi:hypothetical protein